MVSCEPYCSSQSVGTSNHLFLQLIQTVAAAQCLISPPEMWPHDYGKVAKKKGLGTYDFIVVGAGSAGAIVASRLSEIPSWKVLLLEAGGDPPDESVVPFLRSELIGTAYDWQFHDISPRACRVNGAYGCPVARGKMLGGTSSLNWMLYIRGFPDDYNQWANYGAVGWSYEDVLPYFKKSEGNQNVSLVAFDDGKYHSADGPVKVESVPINPLDAVLISAFKEAGIKFVPDINANQIKGFYDYQSTASHGTRYSTAQAFLTRNLKRKNLHVIKHAYVNRVIFDKHNRALGVEFTYKGKCKLIAKCSNEVIVSAGTVQSPTLLMRSGIGPKEELKKHDDYWRCYITYMSTTGTHQVGTAKIGTEPTSVVDSELRVYKTIGLRQIDCGIAPNILSANTNAPGMMIAEKGADLIKKAYLSEFK